ncbi:MAG: ARMT1-like domain-containing protein [candidate division WOR-3 bacterium]
MKTYLDCIPCFFRQAIEASRIAGADEGTEKKIIDEIARVILGIKLTATPPEMGKTIHNLVKKLTGKEDPYKKVKEESTKEALKIYPEIRKKLESTGNRLLFAVELAIAGNIIDYGTKKSLNLQEELSKILQKEEKSIKKESEYLFNFRSFKNDVEKARNILYVADNVGETIFDRILIEEIKRVDPAKEIIYAVKEKPIINDALREDAISAGIDKFAEIISSGSDIPGTILSLCSKEFLECVERADLIISKGQGNFETLSVTGKPVYYLFMAKCAVVAKNVGSEIGDFILLKREV